MFEVGGFLGALETCGMRIEGFILYLSLNALLFCFENGLWLLLKSPSLPAGLE